MKTPIKNIMIFGDSYSTYEGYVPEGYGIWYNWEDRDATDVRRVEETWWYSLSTELSLNIVRNDSWSGSTIGNTGYNGDCSKTNSFLYRLEKLEAEGFFAKNTIDTVFVFGGTNDSWSNAPLGTLKFSDFTTEDLFCVLPAISCFISRLKEILPNANIISLINTDLKPEITEAFIEISRHFVTEFIAFDHITKMNNHPSIRGMIDIREQIKAFLAR